MNDLTPWDTAFVVMAILQFLAVAGIGFVVGGMLATTRKAQRRAQPAINEARAVSQIGLALTTHARDEGQAMAARVTAVQKKVRSRFETTRRIIGELKPHAVETATAAQETSQVMVRKARTLRDLGQRVSRLRNAAQAAMDAAQAGDR